MLNKTFLCDFQTLCYTTICMRNQSCISHHKLVIMTHYDITALLETSPPAFCSTSTATRKSASSLLSSDYWREGGRSRGAFSGFRMCVLIGVSLKKKRVSLLFSGAVVE